MPSTLLIVVLVVTGFLPGGIVPSAPGGRSSPSARTAAVHTALPPPPDTGAGDTGGGTVREALLVDGRFVWPVDGWPPPILRRFDPPPQPWLAGHRGVDLGAGPGATVRAAGDGTVVFAGTVAGQGVVSVAHSGGVRTTYQPVHIGIVAGRKVTAGTPLGTLAAGHPGCPAAACLHWGLRRGPDYLDPLMLLALGRARLLPLTASPQTSPAQPAQAQE
ncbi:murein hydrolase activator EnvC family protein [Catenuloplanes japonicus]|uniref:murein hydrolase activator EnvC family protein n=1 Tax=Catenuloplanes japonicus TaxID=33876 RepID=UPI00068E3FB8|nr:M23 family metallopeptidase [Catenuloplanes japonicus]